MLAILSMVFVLSGLVFVHEIGHFYMAKKVGIRVLKLSLGFGPKLIGFKKGDTEYIISVLPFGGYIKLDGDDALDADYIVKPGDYMASPWWGRCPRKCKISPCIRRDWRHGRRIRSAHANSFAV